MVVVVGWGGAEVERGRTSPDNCLETTESWSCLAICLLFSIIFLIRNEASF